MGSVSRSTPTRSIPEPPCPSQCFQKWTLVCSALPIQRVGNVFNSLTLAGITRIFCSAQQSSYCPSAVSTAKYLGCPLLSFLTLVSWPLYFVEPLTYLRQSYPMSSGLPKVQDPKEARISCRLQRACVAPRAWLQLFSSFSPFLFLLMSRTKEQLGYRVDRGMHVMLLVLGFYTFLSCTILPFSFLSPLSHQSNSFVFCPRSS